MVAAQNWYTRVFWTIKAQNTSVNNLSQVELILRLDFLDYDTLIASCTFHGLANFTLVLHTSLAANMSRMFWKPERLWCVQFNKDCYLLIRLYQNSNVKHQVVFFECICLCVSMRRNWDRMPCLTVSKLLTAYSMRFFNVSPNRTNPSQLFSLLYIAMTLCSAAHQAKVKLETH